MKQLLLYSGGLDSVCAAWKHPAAHLVYVDYNGKYADKEKFYLHKPVAMMGRQVTILKYLDLSGLESGEGAFLPNRNAFLILTAVTCYANKIFDPSEHVEIIINAGAGSIHPDKDPQFAKIMTDLLNHMNRGGKDSPKRTYEVVMPSKHLTKIQSVREYLDNNGDPNVLRESVSCYDPVERQCGHCRSCVRKYFALKVNGIDPGYCPSHEKLLEVKHRALVVGDWCPNEQENMYTLDVLASLGV